jgi:predicted RNA-binding protein with RPS1 domain
MTVKRGGRDSSVSSRESDRRRDRSVSPDYAESMDEVAEGTAVPARGMVIKGKVTRITNFGAFIRVPGYMDGLVHVTRMDNSGRRMFTPDDVRKHMKEGDEIFAKVYISLPNKYSLDFRFINQANGEDLDPNDDQRDKLERKEADDDKHGDRLLDLPNVNQVFSARIHSITKFGAFVELLTSGGDKTEFKHGLLPKGKTLVRNGRGEVLTMSSRVEDSYKVGDELFVKVVEIQTDKGKYNVDMRYVDQTTGDDLDPNHNHSSDKTAGVVKRRSDEYPSERSRRTSRSRSRSIVLRRREPSRDRRERSRSIQRRHDTRRSSSGGFSFYGNAGRDSNRGDEGRNRRDRSPSDIIRRRR